MGVTSSMKKVCLSLAASAVAVSTAGMIGVGAAHADGLPDYLDVGTKDSMSQALSSLEGSNRIDNNPSQAGYDREAQFGSWQKMKKVGEQVGFDKQFVQETSNCNTRQAIMVMTTIPGTFKPGPNFRNDCKFQGEWKDGYGFWADKKSKTGPMKPYLVSDNSSHFDMEHIVALGDAYRSGASKWDDDKRMSISNDPLNITPSDPSANRFKSAKAPADYLPIGSFKCEYAERYTKVKEKYGLTYRQKDKDVLVQTLKECINQG